MKNSLLLLIFAAGIAAVVSRDCRTHSCLNRLYNSYVIKVEKWRRPFGSGTGSFGSFRHSGIVVTLRNGERWLIHKGWGYGDSSSTVITDADYMSSAWIRLGTRYIRRCGKTVHDFMQAGGVSEWYNIAWRNCNDVTDSMWELAGNC